MTSDEQLMEGVRSGDLRQMSPLFERYHRPLFKYCMAIGGNIHIAEDCVQESFRRVLQYRESYRGGVFKVWLYRIARNVAMDLLPGQPLSAPEEEADERPGPECLAINDQHKEVLFDALMRISPVYREVLALARFQELGSREISAITGIAEGTTRVRLHRALKALAREFGQITSQQDCRYE